MLGELVHELLRVQEGFCNRHIEICTDLALNNLAKGRATIGSLPNRCTHFIQSKKGGIGCGHDHHLAADQTGCDCRTARDVISVAHLT